MLKGHLALPLVCLALAGCGAGAVAGSLTSSASGAVAAQSAGFATAKQGLPLADAAAAAWDAGAGLVRVSGTAIDQGYMQGDWSYTYTAPGKSQGLMVVYDGTGTKTFSVARVSANPLPGDTFVVDSQQAVTIAISGGLKSGDVFQISLDEANSQLRPEWTILGDEGQFVVDATTGQLLESP